MRKQEEAMRIMEALTGVDEEFLARCEAENTAGAGADTADIGSGTADSREVAARSTDRRRKRNEYKWRYLGRCAAVLALVAVGAVSWRGFRVSNDMMSNKSASGGSPQAFMADGAFTDSEKEVPENVNPEDRISEYLTSEDKAPEEGIQGEVNEMLPMPAAANTGTDGIDVPDVPNASGSTDGLDDSNVPGGWDSVKVGSISNDAVNKDAEGRVLTAEEAGQVETLGGYVPTELPAGYVFESAQYEGEPGGLTIWWSRSMDSIMLSFEQVDGATVGTVDVQKPETYDSRLYEIPYAETVPEEYRETFLAPVFARDDFSLEMVCSRVLSYSGDSGDTSTPGGDFSVLYDGVLVHFNGRGTPEEIWEMFASISK